PPPLGRPQSRTRAADRGAHREERSLRRAGRRRGARRGRRGGGNPRRRRRGAALVLRPHAGRRDAPPRRGEREPRRRSAHRRQQRFAACGLPPDMTIVTVAEQSEFVEAAIRSVLAAALLGSLLSILVMFGSLRDVRSPFSISLSIPGSVCATFVIMYRLGLSLN